MITDIHTHIYQENEDIFLIYSDNNVRALVCATELAEAEYLLNKQIHNKNIVITVGIHPWKADKINFEDIEKYFNQVKIIGEIGMDNIWCDVDLKVQQDIFEKQLEYAQKENKPVILHTKGQEKQVSEILSAYKMRKLVHWYSCDKYLDKYIEQDCYFSIGPSIYFDNNVANICREVDINRLFVETDGYESINWINNRITKKSDIPDVLKNSIKFIAKEKGYSFDETKKILENNYFRFV